MATPWSDLTVPKSSCNTRPTVMLGACRQQAWLNIWYRSNCQCVFALTILEVSTTQGWERSQFRFFGVRVTHLARWSATTGIFKFMSWSGWNRNYFGKENRNPRTHLKKEIQKSKNLSGRMLPVICSRALGLDQWVESICRHVDLFFLSFFGLEDPSQSLD